MEKKKIESKEKIFFNYIKKLYPIHGVLGLGNRWDKSSTPPKLIKDSKKFLIFDENLKIIFRNNPFNNRGNFHPNVVKKLEEFGLDKNSQSKSDKNENIGWSRFRTEDSVEILLNSLQTSASLEYFANFHSDELDENNWPKRIPEENLDVTPSSKEFEEFVKICEFMRYAINPNSDSRLDLADIEYESFTEKGKETINEAIEWFKNNKSKTPVQDAWLKVLKANKIKVTWEPYDLWCEIPVMKNIDYSSKEKLADKRKIEDEEFRKKITPAMKEEIRKLSEQLKK